MDYEPTKDLGEARHKLRSASKERRRFKALEDFWHNEVRSLKARHNIARRAEFQVSDHAVLRYLERVEGLDVEAFRDKIAGDVRGGKPTGFEIMDCGEYRAIYHEDDLNIVTIVTPPYTRER